MKAIFTILIAIFAANFTFAANGNPTKKASVPTVCTEDTAQISAAMDAVLANILVSNTFSTTATTTENGTRLTLIRKNEILVSNQFAVYNFNKFANLSDVTPAQHTIEIIFLDAEEL